MKTFSEYQAEQTAKLTSCRQRHLNRCRSLLKSCENVPVYVSTDPHVDIDYANYRVFVRRSLEEGYGTFYDLKCDHCGTELINNDPSVCYDSTHPRYRISCPGCGWTAVAANLSSARDKMLDNRPIDLG